MMLFLFGVQLGNEYDDDEEDVVCVAQLWEKMGRSCEKKRATTARTATLHYIQHSG